MRRKVIVPNRELFEDVERMVALGEQVILCTKGQSMLPFIVGGRDSVELTKVDGEVCVGDIVLAKIPTTACYVIHRVMKIEGCRVTLMGDGNIIGTEQCHIDDVVARVTSIITPYKIIKPNSLQYRIYARLWLTMLPCRRYLLAVVRRYYLT